VNAVDPELRKRVEQIKSSPVQLYREAGDYSNRELVEGILVSPDDIAAIEAVARVGLELVLRLDALTGTLLHRAWMKSGRADPLIDADAWDGFALTIRALAEAEGITGARR
jgi:hypothetical protein